MEYICKQVGGASLGAALAQEVMVNWKQVPSPPVRASQELASSFREKPQRWSHFLLETKAIEAAGGGLRLQYRVLGTDTARIGTSLGRRMVGTFQGPTKEFEPTFSKSTSRRRAAPIPARSGRTDGLKLGLGRPKSGSATPGLSRNAIQTDHSTAFDIPFGGGSRREGGLSVLNGNRVPAQAFYSDWRLVKELIVSMYAALISTLVTFEAGEPSPSWLAKRSITAALPTA